MVGTQQRQRQSADRGIPPGTKRKSRRPWRPLRLEKLEGRRLLAGDGILMQNPAYPEDTDGDGVVSPIDALSVINRLNDPTLTDKGQLMTDVDGDGINSPRDALLVINQLNDREQTRVSAIPPEERAANLQQALDSGHLPPNLSPGKALEMINTLSRGGRWELGERFQNGKIVNEQDSAEGTVVSAPAEEAPPDAQNIEPLIDQTTGPLDDPNLIGSPDETVPDLFAELDGEHPLFNEEWWLITLREHNPTLNHDTLEEHVRRSLSERLRSLTNEEHLLEWLDEARIQEIADQLEDSSIPIKDIIGEIFEGRSDLGNIREQIARIFANAELDEILEQFRVDIATLIEAHSLGDEQAQHDAVLTEFFRSPPQSAF